MATPAERTAYSYREDPTVPAFDDDGQIAVMDGDCALCTWGTRTIAKLDKSGTFRL
tara:strand:+ start:162 stop:329 length:168 start_codon:yes stop_codon:yes gene_type:complete